MVRIEWLGETVEVERGVVRAEGDILSILQDTWNMSSDRPHNSPRYPSYDKVVALWVMTWMGEDAKITYEDPPEYVEGRIY